MRIGLIIYGSLETVSGGYLYDRMLVSQLKQRGDEVELISLPPGRYGRKLLDNFMLRQPQGLDVILQDELCHASLRGLESRPHPCPIISIVHNLRSARGRVPQDVLYRIVERAYLEGVDGFVFNSAATSASVWAVIGQSKPHVIATPGGDRLGEVSPAAVEVARAWARSAAPDFPCECCAGQRSPRPVRVSASASTGQLRSGCGWLLRRGAGISRAECADGP